MERERIVSTKFVANTDDHNKKLKEVQKEYKLAAEQIKTADAQVSRYGETTATLNGKLAALESQQKKNTELQRRLTESMSDSTKKVAQLTAEREKLIKQKAELKKRIQEEIKAHGENSEVVRESKEELRKLEQTHGDLTGEINRQERQQVKYGTQLEKTNTKQHELGKRISETELKLKKQTDQMYQAGLKAEEYGKKLQETGKKMTKVGDTISRNISMPIIGAGVAAVKMASDFESAFVGVMKTVDEADVPGGYDAIKKSIRELAKEIPAAHEEIAGVVEVAGQLGIEGESLMSFSKVMLDLGETTDVSAAQAGESLARFANITSMSQKDFDKLGSTIVDLGNNFAASESEIINMGSRLAAAGNQIGLTEPQIMGLSAGLTSLGLEAEAGGSAFSKLMVRLKNAASTGNKDLARFAEVAGMSGADFKKAFEEDAAGALLTFIEGIAKTNEVSGGALMTLEELGIKEIRMRDATLRAAGGFGVLSDALGTADEAWKDNTALVTEAELRYASSESQIKISLNQIKDTAIDVGAKILPFVVDFSKGLADLVGKFSELSPETQNFLLKMAGIAAVTGPVLSSVGRMTTGIGLLTSSFGKVMKSASGLEKMPSLANKALTLGLTPAVGVATAAIGVLAAAAWLSTEKFRIHKKHIDNATQGIEDFALSVKHAEPVISDFNRANGTFDKVIEEKQEKIAKLEPLITEIFSKNVTRRKALTEEEIATINNYNELIDSTNENIRNKYTARLKIAMEKLSEEVAVTEETAASHIATANAYDKELTEITEKTYEDKILIIQDGVRIEQELRNRGRVDEANIQREHNRRMKEAAKTARDAELEEANKATLEYLRSVKDRYAAFHAEELSKLSDLNDVRNEEIAINKKYSKMADDIRDNSIMSERTRTAKLERLRNDKLVELNNLKTKENWIWDENTEKVAGALLNQATSVLVYGGEIDRGTADMVNGILASLGRTPEGAEKVEEMLKTSLEALVTANPELHTEASIIAKNIGDVMDGIADGRYENGQDIMWALLNGIRDGSNELGNALGEVGTAINEHLEIMNRTAAEKVPGITEPFEKAKITFKEFGEQFSLTEEEVIVAVGKIAAEFSMSEEEIMLAVQAWGGDLSDFAAMHKENLGSIEESIKNYVTITTGGFNEIEQKSTVSLKTYMKNMKENQKAVAEWAENTRILMKAGVSEGVIQELSKLGPEGAKQAKQWVDELEKMNGGALTEFDGLNNKTKTFLNDFSDVYEGGLAEANEAATLQHEINDYGGQGAYMIGQFVAGMIAELPYMKEMAEEMGYDAGIFTMFGIEKTEPEARAAAREMADGIVNELGEYPHEANILANEAVLETVRAFREKTPLARSEALKTKDGIIHELDTMPADARKIAENAMKSTGDGIKKNSYKPNEETAALRRKLIDTLSPLERGGKNNGGEFASGVADGIYNKTYLAENAARWLASRTKTAFEKRLEIYSPSRVMRKSATNIPVAVALGIEDETDLVERAMNKLAQIPINAELTSNPAPQTTNNTTRNQSVVNNVVVNATLSGTHDYDELGRTINRHLNNQVTELKIMSGGR